MCLNRLTQVSDEGLSALGADLKELKNLEKLTLNFEYCLFINLVSLSLIGRWLFQKALETKNGFLCWCVASYRMRSHLIMMFLK
jgi:hypothetical protein